MDNSRAYNAPLNGLESLTRTVGCRSRNPGNCAKNSMQGICAFVRKDGLCLSPPKSWPKHFQELAKKHKVVKNLLRRKAS